MDQRGELKTQERKPGVRESKCEMSTQRQTERETNRNKQRRRQRKTDGKAHEEEWCREASRRYLQTVVEQHFETISCQYLH